MNALTHAVTGIRIARDLLLTIRRAAGPLSPLWRNP